MLPPPGDRLGAEASVGEDDGDVRSVDLPGRAIDLLQHAGANRGTTDPVPPVFALNGPDTAGRIDGADITGVVTSTAQTLSSTPVPAHQVPYRELERPMVQGIDLRDAQPQGPSAHALPFGTLPRLLDPQRTPCRSNNDRHHQHPPVNEQPLHDQEHQTDRRSYSHGSYDLLVLLAGPTD